MTKILQLIGEEPADTYSERVTYTRADILIKNCTILPMTGKNVIKHGMIAIENSEITYVGEEATAPKIAAEGIVDAQDQVAIPGLINCHTHVAMTLFRGIAEDQPLNTWLTETIWPIEA